MWDFTFALLLKAAKVEEVNRAVHQAVAAIKAAHPGILRAQGQAATPEKDNLAAPFDAAIALAAGKEGASVEAAGPSQPQEPRVQGKFFRSGNNRLTDAESKKRDYLAKEMQATATNATRSTRSSTAAAAASGSVTKMEPGVDDGVDDNDAANFMAGVGVVSTNSTCGLLFSSN